MQKKIEKQIYIIYNKNRESIIKENEIEEQYKNKSMPIKVYSLSLGCAKI